MNAPISATLSASNNMNISHEGILYSVYAMYFSFIYEVYTIFECGETAAPLNRSLLNVVQA